MAEEVRASYDELQQVAQRFGKAQDQVQKVLQEVKKAMEPLERGSWQGLGSEAFFREMNGTVLPAVNRLISALGEASRTTNGISQTIHKAEEEAAGLFKIS